MCRAQPCFQDRRDSEKCQRVDAICGDLDSVLPETIAYYEQRGAKKVFDPDQYSTDLMKSLKLLSTLTQESVLQEDSSGDSQCDVIVFGSLSGRLDQAFSLMHYLFTFPRTRLVGLRHVYLVTDEGMMFLLSEGTNLIKTPLGPGLFTENVGIIPIGGPSVITTTGLEWDVTDWPTSFGTQMSTSNHIKSDQVRVETEKSVLFTMEFHKRDAT